MDNVPGWYALVLLGLLAYRVTRLVTTDTILDPVRERAHPPRYLADLLGCPWCLGFWVSLLAYLAWLAWPWGTLTVAVPFALSAIAGQLATHEGDD